jgi:hypothetical protein
MDYYIAATLPNFGERRCAVNLNEAYLDFPLSTYAGALTNFGLKRVDVNLVEEARKLIGATRYLREANFREAPHILNCITLIKFLYAKRGIWLPKDFLRWLNFGGEVAQEDLCAEDIVFTPGLFQSRSVQGLSIGHVGMMTTPDSIIHADYRRGVQEVSAREFFAKYPFSAWRRIVPHWEAVVTCIVPSHLEIETSDDILYLIEEPERERMRVKTCLMEMALPPQKLTEEHQ